MSECMIYITTNSSEEAEIIGRNLVSRRLAACVNIIENMKSIYHWEGKIETSQEVIIIAKTKKALVNELIENVKTLHSYKCPCIVAIPIIDGNADYIQWIRNETK
ncbi:MAG TPA: divalent-cation tolerance protein CutA [Spirochaetota bacterium]|nr:divalent-cation tolerance protein CutA [Spirochaetota bacterium]HPS85102.1 divalent-cation tolerance protein CutA [Spirochaetota bacterium]